ncbi:hypothetical protein [Spiroplasma endosymbiont of Cantharis nigra]|uniref:hypothetical protein n=1 Tax=Spiroplasma endosymbiont of Cantharis nigra TaxID=3066278 RepID=UPI0030D3AE2C
MKFNKDFEFSLKVMILMVLLSFLAFDFVLQIYAPKKNLEGIPTLERLNIYYSFFTTQSNYAVVFYLAMAIFMKKIYNTKPPFSVELAMTVYISLTMIVFWLGLVASVDEMGAYYPSSWVSTSVLHVFIPSIMIGYFIFSCGDQYYSPRRYSKFSLPMNCFYPTGYLIFAMIRGELRYKFYSPEFYSRIYSPPSDILNPTAPGYNYFWNNIWSPENGVIDKSRHFTDQMWYPYWFLNIHQYELSYTVDGQKYIAGESFGPEWLVICTFLFACLCITLIVVGLQFVFLKWNNGKFYRWHDIEGKLITREEHAYRIQKRKLQKIRLKSQNKMDIIHKKTEYKVFLKGIKSLEKNERKVKKNEYIKSRILEHKLEIASIKNEKIAQKNNKIKIKGWILSLNYKDRSFVKENLREAERYKKLVKNGVLIFKTKYVN